MSNEKDRLYVVSYDLSDDRERSKASDIIGAYGFRVQYSVFECRMTPVVRDKLFDALQSFEFTSGHVRVYQVYDSSLERFGDFDDNELDSGSAFVI